MTRSRQAQPRARRLGSMAWAPERGDVVWITMDPTAGHEQCGRRPALVLSPGSYNSKVGLALLCPITSQVKGYPFEVAMPEGLPIQGVRPLGSGQESRLAVTKGRADLRDAFRGHDSGSAAAGAAGHAIASVEPPIDGALPRWLGGRQSPHRCPTPTTLERLLESTRWSSVAPVRPSRRGYPVKLGTPQSAAARPR